MPWWWKIGRFVGFAERKDEVIVAARGSWVGVQRIEMVVDLRMYHRSLDVGIARTAYSESPRVSC